MSVRRELGSTVVLALVALSGCRRQDRDATRGEATPPGCQRIADCIDPACHLSRPRMIAAFCASGPSVAVEGDELIEIGQHGFVAVRYDDADRPVGVQWLDAQRSFRCAGLPVAIRPGSEGLNTRACETATLPRGIFLAVVPRELETATVRVHAAPCAPKETSGAAGPFVYDCADAVADVAVTVIDGDTTCTTARTPSVGRATGLALVKRCDELTSFVWR